jgi:hypothetical protein
MLEFLKKRRSCRNFTGELISEEIMESILKSSEYAPKAGNKIYWKITLIKDKNIIKYLSGRPTFYQYFISKASHVAIVELDRVELYRDYKTRGVMLYGLQGSSAAIQNMILMSLYYNIGSCWVGSFDQELVKKLIKSDKFPVAMIVFGIKMEEK